MKHSLDEVRNVIETHTWLAPYHRDLFVWMLKRLERGTIRYEVKDDKTTSVA